MCFWASLIAGFQKCHFYFFAMSRNTQNRSLKNYVINGYGFWAICLQKIDISTWNLACQVSRHSSSTFCQFLLKILESYKNNIFSFFCKKKYFFFGKIRECHFKELFILRTLVLFIWILPKIAIFVIFETFINVRPKSGTTLWHLHRYNSKSFQENFPKFCVRT